jgi:hypothetical protein
VAHTISPNAIGYRILLGAFGVGAVGGAVVMQRARARWSSEAVVSAAIAILGMMTVAVAAVHTLTVLTAVMFISGGAWITFISVANGLVQQLAPDWVRARVLAIFMLITQGGLAAGSVVWGTVASRMSVSAALILSGIATIATTTLGLISRLPDDVSDISPWNHWRLPAIDRSAEPGPDEGPVLITVEYRVLPDHVDDFLDAMEGLGRVRRRDGASPWGIFRDMEQPGRYIETFIVTSWAEHLRQHERLTRADSAIEEAVRSHVQHDPVISHLIYAGCSS